MTIPHSARPIAVIGAGFSGTMTALHLLPRLAARPILLCERGERFARGVAYGTADRGHLLNVRAGNMSAFPEKPDHFLGWLAREEAGPGEVHATEAGTFVSRRLYGSYLTDLLSEAVASPGGCSGLILVADEVVDLVPTAEGYRLVLAGGLVHEVAGAVLALGNMLPAAAPPGPIVANPWAVPFAEGLRAGEPVVVVGSGLTMVDVALQLRHAGFAGPVVAVSRRGLRPHSHAPTRPWPAPAFTAAEHASPARLLRRLRREVAEAAAQGADWRGVVDGLRPLVAELWQGFGPERRAGFLRHARPWWDIHRHRMAPPVADQLAVLVDSGFLRICAGHVLDIAAEGNRARVTVRPRGQAETHVIAAQRVITAAGTTAPDRAGHPLVDRLIERGLARLDRHRLGLDLTDDLHVVGSAGQASPGLWALGPVGAGTFWECVAVPDIRGQAARLADQVAVWLTKGDPR